MNKTKSSRQFTAEPKRRRPRQVDDALVYLKLRESNCDKKKALIFTSRKEHKVFYRTDATVERDGPASCRTLIPCVSKQCVHAGWMINSKLRYIDTMCPSKQFRDNDNAKQRKGIISMVHGERRRLASAKEEYRMHEEDITSIVTDQYLNLAKIKDYVAKMKRKPKNPVQCQGIKMLQMSPFLVKEEQMRKNDSLISRLDAFKSVDTNKTVPSPRKRSLTRTTQTGPKSRRLSVYDLAESKYFQTNPTPRLHMKSQLVNFGSRNQDDSEFYYNLQKTIKKLPVHRLRESVQTICVQQID